MTIPAWQPVPGWPRLPAGLTIDEAVSVATDSRDRVYVFGRSVQQLMVFDPDGTFLNSWGSARFTRPHGITIGPDDALYLTDDLDHTVHKYTSAGTRLWTLGVSGQPSATGYRDMDYRTIQHAGPPFHQPTNLALDSEGCLYIADGYGNACVHKFSPHGELLFSFGEPGSGPGEFHVPHGIAVDSNGRIIVADRENSRLQFFTPSGEYLHEWRDVLRPCEVYAAASGLLCVAELGLQAGLWPWMQSGVQGARVSVFAPTGEVLARWGTGQNPMADDDFFAPHDIWLDQQGSLYIAEVSRAAGCAKAGFPHCPTLRKYTPA